MQWVDRLQEAVGSQEAPWECDWTETETELGTALPSDFKAMYGRFGPGYFSLVLWLRGDRGRNSLIGSWRRFQESYLRRREAGQPSDTFKPYQIYLPGQGEGVIPWGWSQTDGRFYWLADSDTDPDAWPVVCTLETGGEWYLAAVSTSEFVYRVLADPGFEPYSVAEFVNPPTFNRPDALD